MLFCQCEITGEEFIMEIVRDPFCSGNTERQTGKTSRAADASHLARTDSQGVMAQPARNRIFEFEIDIFNQQVDAEQRLAARSFAQNCRIIADSEYQLFGLSLGRLLSDALDEIEFTLHLIVKREYG